MGVVTTTSTYDIASANAAVTSAAASAYSAALVNPVTTDDVSTAAATSTDSADAAAETGLSKRAACDPQPKGSGPVSSPDTPAAFQSNLIYNQTASAAIIPDGYALAWPTPRQGATEGSTYITYYTLTSFDTLKCQQKCDQADSCYAFNVYFERDPTKEPGYTSCQNPPSTTNIKCALFGAQIDEKTATNAGQWRADFQILIAGSMGYNKLAAPPLNQYFNAPTELGGAIQAPSGFMGSRYYTGAYNPAQCIQACTGTNAYSQKHPRSDGTYDPCNFVNSYVLSKNGAPQGTYCSMYTSTWGKSLSTNYGQWRGTDQYTVSQSYGWTITNTDSGVVTKA